MNSFRRTTVIQFRVREVLRETSTRKTEKKRELESRKTERVNYKVNPLHMERSRTCIKMGTSRSRITGKQKVKSIKRISDKTENYLL